MVVQTNNSISRETQDLVWAIRYDTDPVEKDLPRLAYRVLGWLTVGLFFGDACADQLKSDRLQSRLARLENTVANNASETSDLGVQKRIYTNIKNYTDNARNIKLGTGACSMLSTVLEMHALATGNLLSDHLAYIATLGLVAGFGLAVTHRYSAGTLMKATNRELAESTVKV